MSPRGAAILAILGVAVPFLVRTGNSIFPRLLDSTADVVLVEALFLLASVGLAAAISVIARTLSGGVGRMAHLGGLAAAGVAVAAAANLVRFLDAAGVNPIDSSAYRGALASGANLVTSLSVLVFFVALSSHLGRELSGRRSAVAGAAFFLALAVLRTTGGVAWAAAPLLAAGFLLAIPALAGEIWCLVSLRRRLPASLPGFPSGADAPRR